MATWPDNRNKHWCSQDAKDLKQIDSSLSASSSSGINAAVFAQRDEIPPELYAGIGEIIARWGYLQFQLGVIVRVSLGLKKDVGRVMTARMEVWQLCEALKTVSKIDRWIKDAELRETVRKFAGDVLNAAEIRNDYAHGVFGYTEEKPPQFGRFLFKEPEHKVTPGFEILTPETLKVQANEARALWDRAQAITRKLKGKGP
jgi:hypothetical protein